MTPTAIEAILSHVEFPNTRFLVRVSDEGTGCAPYLQLEQKGQCNVTGAPVRWRGRKWKLSAHMTKSEIVQTAFLAVLTAVEHETRETFKFKGAAIFGPHFDVERLVTLAGDPKAQDTR
ncbi:MAG: hypothetical protein AB7F39_06470 [Variibacter sp.]